MLGQPKILYLDIETMPKLAYVWRFFKENINTRQVLDHGYIASFSAIWGDDPDKKVIYIENRTEDDTEITYELLKLLDEADIVIGHNVEWFDIGTVYARALILGLEPPSPFKIIDTYKVAKKHFRFEKNSLEYLTEVLPVKHKKLMHAKYPGWELWLACLKQDEAAWKEMRAYNINDTLAVRDVYKIFRPWITNHPNVGNYLGLDRPVCPKCGSTHIHFRGYTSGNSNVGVFRKFVCLDCRGWSRTRKSEKAKVIAEALITNG